MNFFAQNKNLRVISSFSNATDTGSMTLSQLQDRQKQLSISCPNLQAAYQRIDVELTALGNQIGSENLTPEAVAERQTALGKMNACYDELKSVNAQITNMLGAQAADVANQLAQANLTPDQRLALQKEADALAVQQQQQKDAAAAALAAADKKSSNTKILFIGLALLLGLIGIGFLIKEIHSRSAAKAAA